MTPTDPSSGPASPRRQVLLDELASIFSMERGALVEEFRISKVPDGSGEFRRGPYYKHQCWEGGRNRSCRVPAEQVGQLREDLANGRRFEEIAGELADIAVAEGRSRRGSRKAGGEAGGDAKKNSASSASRSATAKPKPSSGPSGSDSGGKASPR